MRTVLNKPDASEALMNEALQRFRAFLHERWLWLTDVREAMVRAALSREGHFRVEEALFLDP